jgi:hypothetical protein
VTVCGTLIIIRIRLIRISLGFTSGVTRGVSGVTSGASPPPGPPGATPGVTSCVTHVHGVCASSGASPRSSCGSGEQPAPRQRQLLWLNHFL